MNLIITRTLESKNTELGNETPNTHTPLGSKAEERTHVSSVPTKPYIKGKTLMPHKPAVTNKKGTPVPQVSSNPHDKRKTIMSQKSSKPSVGGETPLAKTSWPSARLGLLPPQTL